VLLATSVTSAYAGGHAHTGTDPFTTLEREGQAARRAENRERADRVEENYARARERERDRLNVDDYETDDLRDDGSAADE
jgi:hypothetical protein